MNKPLKIFTVYHKTINEDIVFKNISHEYVKNTIVYYGVNDIYEKKLENKYGCDTILEYKLEKYNPFLQLRSYMETSAYLHIYNNNLHNDLDFIGIFQHDMIHSKEYTNLDDNTIYILDTNQPIVIDNEWSRLMSSDIRNIYILLNSYNSFFGKNITKKNLENIPLSLFYTNIYPKKIFNKLCSWLNVLVNEVYPWSIDPKYETDWEVMGGFTERAIGLFNAVEISLGSRYEKIVDNRVMLEKDQYDKNFVLNYYDVNVNSKYIENITNKDEINGLNYAMFKSIWYEDTNFDNYYYAERLSIHGKNGLKLGKKNDDNYRLVGFNMEAEDPRLIFFNNKLYVVFICLSVYQGQQLRGIGFSEFDHWNPVFLRVRDMPFNHTEKNWAPLVKDNKLYFIYNEDPLIVLSYDLNLYGVCDVVFRQDNIKLPINTNEPNILRGSSIFIHYNDHYYIGLCHDRIYLNDRYNHFTRIVLLDVENWKIVYVSKTIIYKYEDSDLNKINNTNILYPIKGHLILYPVSIFRISENKFHITVNICDYKTLLYEIEVNIPKECYQNYNNIFDIQKKTHNEITKLITYFH